MEQIDPPISSSAVYAGFWNRVIAWIIDGILLSVVTSIIAIVFGLGSTINYTSIEDIDFAAIYGGQSAASVIIGWLYFALMESSKHQATVGKLAMRLLVTDMNGDKISFARATGRYFGKIISAIILLIGYFMAGFTEKKQALHDILAGCLVIKNKG